MFAALRNKIAFSAVEGERNMWKTLALTIMQFGVDQINFSSDLMWKFLSIMIVGGVGVHYLWNLIWTPFTLGVIVTGFINYLRKVDPLAKKVENVVLKSAEFTLTHMEKFALGVILIGMFGKLFKQVYPQEKKESKSSIRDKIMNTFDVIFTLLLIPMAYKLGVHKCQQVFQKSAGYLAMVMAAVNTFLILKGALFTSDSGTIDNALKESAVQVSSIEKEIVKVGFVIGAEEEKNVKPENRQIPITLQGKENVQKSWAGLRAIWGQPPRAANDHAGIGAPQRPHGYNRYCNCDKCRSDPRREKEVEPELESVTGFNFLAGHNLALAIAALVVVTTVSLALVKYFHKDSKVELHKVDLEGGKGAKAKRDQKRSKKGARLYTQSGGVIVDPEFDQDMYIRNFHDDGTFDYVPYRGDKTFLDSGDDKGWYAQFDDPEYYRPTSLRQEATIAGKKAFPVGFVEKSVGYCFTERKRMCCTIIQGCVVTCAHVFDGCSDTTIHFRFGSLTFDSSLKYASPVGNDLVAFRLPSSLGLKSLKIAGATENQPCAVVTYHSEEDNKAGHSFVSYGKVKQVLSQLFHTCTTEDGVCGSPIINDAGRVLAIHNSTTGSGDNLINIGQFVVPNVADLVHDRLRHVKEAAETHCLDPKCDKNCGLFHTIAKARKPLPDKFKPCYQKKYKGNCTRPNCVFRHTCHRWCNDKACLLSHIEQPKLESEKEEKYPLSLNSRAPLMM